MNTKITDTELKELDALLVQRDELNQKIKAITDKHPHCFECGAFEGELHDKDCDCAMCMMCGKQINDPSARGCKCDEPVISEFEARQ